MPDLANLGPLVIVVPGAVVILVVSALVWGRRSFHVKRDRTVNAQHGLEPEIGPADRES